MLALIPWLATAATAIFGSYKRFFLVLVGMMVGPLIIKALAALGAGWAVYELGDYALTAIYAEIQSSTLALPPLVVSSLALLRLDEALQTIFAAFTARLVLNGFQDGIMKVFIWR
jgi:ABC-type Co2+ transport system permease subunit